MENSNFLFLCETKPHNIFVWGGRGKKIKKKTQPVRIISKFYFASGLKQIQDFQRRCCSSSQHLGCPSAGQAGCCKHGVQTGGDGAGRYPRPLASPARDYRKGASLWRRPAGNFWSRPVISPVSLAAKRWKSNCTISKSFSVGNGPVLSHM